MLNETSHEEALRYNAIAERIKIYAGIVLYTACLFGTLMNMLTFLRRTYYNRSCSLYLLAASILDFIQLNLEPLPSIFHYALRFDGTVRSLVLCKLKSYTVFVVSVTSATLTVLVAIDRYVLSSRDTARWKYCTRAIAVRCIQSCVVFWIFVSIPITFCYTCFNHLSEPETLICSNPSSSIKCFTVQLVYVCLFNGFFPPLVMMFFGCLAYVNVYQLQKRSQVKSARTQQLNYQLSSMLILQSIKSSFSSIPYATFKTYMLATRTMEKSLVYRAKEHLVHQIVYLLFWSNYTSFFVYLYSSDIFRRHWIRAMRKLIYRLSGNTLRRFSYRSEMMRLTPY